MADDETTPSQQVGRQPKGYKGLDQRISAIEQLNSQLITLTASHDFTAGTTGAIVIGSVPAFSIVLGAYGFVTTAFSGGATGSLEVKIGSVSLGVQTLGTTAMGAASTPRYVGANVPVAIGTDAVDVTVEVTGDRTAGDGRLVLLVAQEQVA